MANEIPQKYSAVNNFTITLASLADSSSGVGRQSTMVTTATDYECIHVDLKVKQGTSPTGNRYVYVYVIRGNGTGRDDGAGASDAALTVYSAECLGAMPNKASPATGDLLQKHFTIERPGLEFGIVVVNNTGVNLDSTEGNHSYTWYGVLPEVQ
jgi:hypothetical protein